MMRLSSGLRRAVVSNTGLGSMLNGGRIHLYAGAQPVSADIGATGVLVAIITQDGALSAQDSGLLLAQGDAAGTLVNSGSWVISGIVAGTAHWWRFVGDPQDTGTDDSIFAVRLDGAIGEGFSAEGLPAIPLEAFIDVDKFLLTLPANN